MQADELALANRWQRDFPLASRPFGELARQSGLSEEAVLEACRRLQQEGVLDRIGPVYRPNAVGASSLAAMAVPPERLEAVARFVSEQPGINHNYQREHRYNLWFVATAPGNAEVQWTLSCIEYATGLRVLRLPLLEEYHVDLGFNLETHAAPRAAVPKITAAISEEEKALVRHTVRGLPLVARPYAAVATELGVDERDVLEGLSRMLADGRIRRLGAVIRHRRLGYRANAMAVWDVPDDRVCGIAPLLARDPAVTLCYRRSRALPQWPYNLYCMVHGRERGRVASELARMNDAYGLERFAKAVLFSERCFSQRAANYG